ncbi:Uncharacterized protein TPAR_03767 [Tolypocladium paradoxum]|uniref:Uncharacterized protein n=1 Tax=Tolypocladium paradoxum TaxID=94208 RepID=A0A2S4L0U7_9HYPO|nr:Uncharacterized protein TPAR_03767 [Tolypocladium paradoxum]
MEEQQASPNAGGVKYGFEDASTFTIYLVLPANKVPGIDHGWKPFSMTAPVLACLAALSLLIAAGIETLAQRSSENGGLALSPSLDDVPRWVTFAYKYVPNIAAALYSLMWSWVDLDVKRMQPWFELSKPGGARGEDSLFLDYPCEFVAFVPWTSAKKKHWLVFLSGTTMMIIFWLITPLQSSIFGTGTVFRTQPVTLMNRSQLLPMADQVSLLGPEVLNIGYAIGWLGQTYPPFTAPEYALLPYYVAKDPAPTTSEANWTATTTKLSTEITCWPAQVTRKGKSTEYYFLNGQGCNATIPLPGPLSYTMQYVGYYSSAYSDLFLAGPDCPETPDSIHQFLAIWARSDPALDIMTYPDLNITARYCQSHYYKEQVVASVRARDLLPDTSALQTVSERQPLTESEFNSTAFEYVIANGMDWGAEVAIRDAPFYFVIDQHLRLIKYNLTYPVATMAGYALAGQNLSMDEYSDPTTLDKAYNRAHQYLFSVAVSRLLVNETTFSNRTASSTFPLSGVIVSRVFSAVVEGLLVLSTVLTFFLLWLCHKAPSKLRSNPNSISRLSEIFRNSPETLEVFRTVDNANEKSLLELFRNETFRLSYRDGPAEGKDNLQIEIITEPDSRQETQELETQESYYDPIRPFALTRKTGFIFIFILLSAIAVISWLKSVEVAQTGLPRPSQNFEVLQILENYIPTAFATLIEPFWVLLNRMLCVMQPFQDLGAGRAQPSRTIDSTYTAIPPQLAVWRAVKARHFILMLICVTTLLANLLGVGMGALFNENITTAEYSEPMEPILSPMLTNKSVSEFPEFISDHLYNTATYKEHFYFAMANMTRGTPLGPWISPGYFFQPYNFVPRNSSSHEDTYTLQTRGFGANANCRPVPARPMPVGGPIISFHKRANSTSCPDVIVNAGAAMRQTQFAMEQYYGISAIEYIQRVNSEAGDHCPNLLVLGWGRTPDGRKALNGSVQASFAICEPLFETAMFNVTVDASGNVISYNRTSNIETTQGYADDVHIGEMLTSYASGLVQQPRFSWHNDTIARDWLNYLVTVSIESRDQLDPMKPPPDPTKLIPAIEDVYRRTFALFIGLGRASLFAKGNPSESITGTSHAQETRIFLDKAALIITLSVLSLNVIVATIFYARAIVFVLPRMPTSIGSILAYVAPSRAVARLNRRDLGLQNRTYSFGRYVGVDKKSHIGVELDPYVVPIPSSSLRGERTVLDRLPTGLSRRKTTNLRAGSWL